MLTPQEVASRAFAKATLGGYNMAMVDEFLDQLTEDYTALYNDNAILKNKLKVLSETVEEYRATDNAMRKTLLAAQQMADSIVHEAQERKSQLVKDAEADAETRIAQLHDAIAAQEYQLQQAQQATAAYAEKLRKLHHEQISFLDQLDQLAPPKTNHTPDLTAEIEASVSAVLQEDEGDEPTVVAAAQQIQQNPSQVDNSDDPDATRRFEDLQFGKDYEII